MIYNPGRLPPPRRRTPPKDRGALIAAWIAIILLAAFVIFIP